MLKWLIIIAAIFILYKLLVNDRRKKASLEVKTEEKVTPTGDMVRDPVCGAYVALDSDIRVRQGDQVHHFCSYECRDKYLKQLSAHEIKSESVE